VPKGAGATHVEADYYPSPVKIGIRRALGLHTGTSAGERIAGELEGS
jgi:hypothetical protein